MVISAAQTPPMGWRSWNLYQGNVNQTLMEQTMRGVAERRHEHYSGASLSLCDLGYCDVGLDDNWQQCDSPLVAEGMRYHDETGASIVNKAKFPNLANHCKTEQTCEMQIQQDAKTTAELQFDGIKLDGCGGQMNLTMWEYYLNLYSPNKTIVVENCHWGKGKPPSRVDCPYHFYRSSLDIYPTYVSVVYNLHSVEPYRRQNLSFPGCWAYPDMLQVGVRNEQFPGLTPAETRTHFGAWAIVSSPLVLSHDVNDDTITSMIWDLISNLEVIEVNQNYVGDSGGRYWQSSETISMGDLQLTSGEIAPMRSIPVVEYYSLVTVWQSWR